MIHHLEVSLSPRKPQSPLLELKTRRIGVRLWKHLFGRQRIVILFPGESIEAVTITEQPQGGGDDAAAS